MDLLQMERYYERNYVSRGVYMIHKILVEIETEEGITFEEVLKDIETQFFAEGEIFDVKGTDADSNTNNFSLK